MFARRLRRLRIAGIGLVLAALVACAHGGGPPGAPFSIPSRPESVYTSSGQLFALEVSPDVDRQAVLIGELAAPGGAATPAKAHLEWLDLKTRRTTQIGEYDRYPGRFADGPPAVAPSGRVAVPCWDVGPNARSTIRLWEPDGKYRELGSVKGRMRFVVRWSPDSSHLAYFRLDDPLQLGPLRLVVAAAAVGDELAEREVQSDCTGYDDFRWSRDGLKLYLLKYFRNGRYGLVSVDPESGQSARIAGADAEWMGCLNVAQTSGDVFWLAARRNGKEWGPITVWRLALGQAAMETRLRLSGVPQEAVVSPDGRDMAVVTQKGEVMICNLVEGTKRSATTVPLRYPWGLAWVLSGRGLVVTSEEKAVLLIPSGLPAATGTGTADRTRHPEE